MSQTTESTSKSKKRTLNDCDRTPSQPSTSSKRPRQPPPAPIPGTFRTARLPKSLSEQSQRTVTSKDGSSTSETTTIARNSSGRLKVSKSTINYRKTSDDHNNPAGQYSTTTPQHLPDPSPHIPELGHDHTTPTPKQKRKREAPNMQLAQWIVLRNMLLDEFLRHNGIQDRIIMCQHCSKEPGIYRCGDCGHGKTLYCAPCMVALHEGLELHRIEKWTGLFFDKASLCQLGHRVQLGHDGGKCPVPVPGPKGFLVFDISGAHYVNIDYCGCLETPIEKVQQLLRKKWFPATIKQPHTAFTFECLDTFHKLTHQSKTTAYDFYHMILHKTDHPNINATIYRYAEFNRAFRLFRNVMALKRAGRGQDPAGVDGTPEGGVAVECPACPHPGKNLPDGWEAAGQLMFLYTLYLAVDANFKLKGKQRFLKDVELMPGKGVFVNETDYQHHLKSATDLPETNTCESEHDAIVKATTKVSSRYAISGKGLVLCSRHLLIRKNGVGDLQVGERYANMDFIVLSALKGLNLRRILITYDIACQWSKNLSKRMAEFPADMKIDPQKTRIDFAIPSWHINGHGQSCRENFNVGYIPGAAKTCGEEVEIPWSVSNALAPSLAEMAVGAQHDTLNDHWAAWNFRRIVTFRNHFLRRFLESIKNSKKQEEIYNQLASTFEPQVVESWTEMLDTWHVDKTAPNPYEEPQCGTSLQETRIAMAKEDAIEAEKGKNAAAKQPLGSFFWTAFDIEERQYTLSQTTSDHIKKTRKSTTKDMADNQDKENVLQRTIRQWRDDQLIYTPFAASLIASDPCLNNPENPAPVHLIPLYLPSSFPPEARASIPDICDRERRLRIGQAEDALMGIRRQRRVIQTLSKFRSANISGTGNRHNTRATSVFKQIHDKIRLLTARYRRARAALLVLDPTGDWQVHLKELNDGDVSGPAKEQRDKKELSNSKETDNLSHSRYVPSWIWLVARKSPREEEVAAEFNESMRVKWAKAYARMLRWLEEKLLIQEEMRRVLAWLEDRAKWWEGCAKQRAAGDSLVLCGVSAYAHKQAYICRKMADRCATHWLPALVESGITPAWALQYSNLLAEIQAKLEKKRKTAQGDGGDRVEVVDKGKNKEQGGDILEDDEDDDDRVEGESEDERSDTELDQGSDDSDTESFD